MSLARPLRSIAVALLLVTLAPAARAGGINLSWDDCGSSGFAQKSFACTSNSGIHYFFVSAIPNAPIPLLNGQTDVLTIQTPSATLPAWWQWQNGGCHSLSLATSFLFSSMSNCTDPWGDQAVGGHIFDYPVSGYGADVGRLQAISALPAGAEMPADDVHELYLARVGLNHNRSAGAGACAGCLQSACIVLKSVTLCGPNGSPTYLLTNPLLRQHIVWQDPAQLAGCPGATPARDRTWGAVKSLYR